MKRNLFIGFAVLVLIIGIIASFAPTEESTDTRGQREVKLGETIGFLDVKINPLELIEDSRCPIDVQCIQAGTVRVQTRIVSGLGESTMIMELNKPITTEAEEIILINVMPVAESTKTISESDYVFTFSVSKKNVLFVPETNNL
ncbi:MAG: hypothetical protein AAB407_02875 [Patescibacteria group bacterium]